MQTYIRIISVIISVFFANFVSGQAKVEWKERSEFHKVMSQTFHPMEEGNFEPIRTRSAEMVQKAVAWSKSAIPVEYKEMKNMKKNLKILVKNSKDLHKNIQSNCTDAVIRTQLTALYDTFHQIVGLCKAGD